jgi:outer membrane beta-barrel protein
MGFGGKKSRITNSNKRGLVMNGRWAIRTIISFVVLAVGIPAFAQETKLDTNLDKIWGQERELKVIEKKQFLPDFRHEVGIFLGVIPNDPFFVFVPIGLRYEYHFMESLSFELAGCYAPSAETGLVGEIKSGTGNAIFRGDLLERFNWYVDANIKWAPFHGKFQVMNKRITSFDAGFLVGIGVMGSQVYKGGELETRWNYDGAIPFNLMANLGAFIKFWVTDYLAVSIDYRHYIYPKFPGFNTDGSVKGEWSDGVSSLAEISFGLTYVTPAPK